MLSNLVRNYWFNATRYMAYNEVCICVLNTSRLLGFFGRECHHTGWWQQHVLITNNTCSIFLTVIHFTEDQVLLLFCRTRLNPNAFEKVFLSIVWDKLNEHIPKVPYHAYEFYNILQETDLVNMHLFMYKFVHFFPVTTWKMGTRHYIHPLIRSFRDHTLLINVHMYNMS